MYGLNASSIPYDGVNKYLRITDIDDKNHKLIMNNLTSPNVKLEDSQDYLLHPGDILFARTGASVGKTYLYNNSDGIVFFAGFLIRMKTKDIYDERFIFQNTLTEKYNNFVQITSQRSGQPGINAKEYSQFHLYVPTEINEQNKVGSITEKLDLLIELHQEKLTLYESLKKSLLGILFPSKNKIIPNVRFLGFDKNWEKHKLKELRDPNDKYSYTGGPFGSDLKSSDYTAKGVRIIQLQNIGDGYFDDNYKIFTSYEKSRKLFSNLIYPNEIIIAKMAAPLARATIVPSNDVKYLLSSDGIRLKVDSSKYNTYFIYTLINDTKFRNKALKKSTGTTRKRIGLVTLGEIESYIPDNDEQINIGNLIKHIDFIINLQHDKINQLNLIKKYYLQKLFI